MAKKKKVGIPIVIIFILILGVVGYLFYAGVLQETYPGFTPIYCRDYEFTCCGETIDYTLTSKTLNIF